MASNVPTTAANKPYKAVAAFVLTFLGLIVQAVTGHGDGAITVKEWVVIVIGSLVTTGAVYGINNNPTSRNRLR